MHIFLALAIVRTGPKSLEIMRLKSYKGIIKFTERRS